MKKAFHKATVSAALLTMALTVTQPAVPLLCQYYIDGNNTTNGNGSKSCVHYSKCSKTDSRFTCVLRPNYR
jgi:hypothetical protein